MYDLKAACAYNAVQAGVLWQINLLPWWLYKLAPASPEFAESVAHYQDVHGLGVDGKLGPNTWHQVCATEGVRLPGSGGDYGPTYLPNTVVVPTARVEIPRKSPVVGVGIHTTGSGVLATAQQHGVTIDQVLRNLLSAPSAYTSAGYVTEDGSTILCVPVDEQAVHGGYGSRIRDLYDQGYAYWSRWKGMTGDDLVQAEAGRYDGWKAIADQEGFNDPLDLTVDPNGTLWAFDLVPQVVGGHEVFSDAQYQRAAEMVAWAAEHFGFKPRFRTVLEHQLWNPICRWHWCPGAGFSRIKLGNALRKILCDDTLRLGGDDR